MLHKKNNTPEKALLEKLVKQAKSKSKLPIDQTIELNNTPDDYELFNAPESDAEILEMLGTNFNPDPNDISEKIRQSDGTIFELYPDGRITSVRKLRKLLPPKK